MYLDYEGDLTANRGRVHRVAHGQCDIEIGEDAPVENRAARPRICDAPAAAGRWREMELRAGVICMGTCPPTGEQNPLPCDT